MMGNRRCDARLLGTPALAAMLCAAAPALGQSAGTDPQSAASGATPENTPVSSSQTASEAGSDATEIVVTGTSIRGVPPTGSNLIRVSREDIKLIGAATTPDLLATVPQLNSFNTAPRTSNGGLGSFAPGLRGLPSSATLPLMNGHRLISGSTQQTNPDFPFLPELAIERVEIVADGASAIYGSDAVAGVVNFITRSHFSGVEATVRYGMADDYHTFSSGAIAGKDWGSGSVAASYQYSQNNNITGADRRYRSLDFRAAGGVDTRAAVCPAANVNLFLGTVYAAPSLAPGTNTCDPRGPVDLLPANRTHSAYLTARQDVTPTVTLWGEMLYSDRKDTVQAALPGQTFVLILPTNPFYRAPPGTAVGYEYVDFRPDNLVGGDHFDQVFRVRSGNSSAGVDVRLPAEFKLSVSGTFNWSRNDTLQPGIDTTALTAAASGTTLATALDPFGTRTSPAVIAAILNNPTDFTNHQRTKLGALRIDGPLAQLPGGQVKIAAGAEYRRETYEQRGSSGGIPFPENLDRNVGSLYGELFVPLFGQGNEAPLMHSLSLSLSGRYDHYSDFGSTTNPKIGIDWEPLGGLTVRGTYGRSFRAPGLRDLGSTVGSYYAAAALVDSFGVRDPARGATQVNTILLLGGNKSLKPEKARTFSVGADLRPSFLPGFTASATFYDIVYNDVIGTPYGLGALIFTDPTFVSRVVRDPSAAQVASAIGNTVPFYFTFAAVPTIANLLDLRQGNFGVRKTNGLDFDVNYRRQIPRGFVFAGVAGNYIFKYETQFSATSAFSNSLEAGVPRTTLRTTLGFTAGPVTVANFVNYRSGITSAYATPTGSALYSAKGYTTVDLRLSVALPNVGLAKGTVLSMQINDLFDATPPYFPGSDGIGGGYNPIGRYAAVNLRKTF
jgi:iron complex outermembrane receptor protein